MLAITDDAMAAIRALEAERGGAVRISTSPISLNGSGPVLSIEVADAPGDEDEVLEADGAVVYLAPSAAAFEDRVLDADVDGHEVHFSLHDKPDSA